MNPIIDDQMNDEDVEAVFEYAELLMNKTE